MMYNNPIMRHLWDGPKEHFESRVRRYATFLSGTSYSSLDLLNMMQSSAIDASPSPRYGLLGNERTRHTSLIGGDSYYAAEEECSAIRDRYEFFTSSNGISKQVTFLNNIGIHNYPLADIDNLVCQWVYNDIVDLGKNDNDQASISISVRDPLTVAGRIKWHVVAYCSALGDLASAYSPTSLFERFFVKYFLEYII